MLTDLMIEASLLLQETIEKKHLEIKIIEMNMIKDDI